MLVDRQWRWREERALKTRLRNAKFKLQACIEDVDYRASRGVEARTDRSALQLRMGRLPSES